MFVRTLKRIYRQTKRRFDAPTSVAAIGSVIRQLGIQPGSTIFVHSSLRSVGGFAGSAEGLLRILMDAVGPEGTLAMPSFTFSGSVQDFVESTSVVDLRTAPSRTGYLSECFRQMPGVLRSFHPTHPVCAWGRNAAHLTGGHELAPGLCGRGTPFERLLDLDAQILRIGIAANTISHFIQEEVAFPNLFLPEPRTIRCTGPEGETREMQIRVYRKQIPSLLYVTGAEGQPVAMYFSNFPLPYGADALIAIGKDPLQAPVHARVMAIRAEFESNGWLRTATLHDRLWETFSTRSFVGTAVREWSAEIEAHRTKYSLPELERLYEAGQFPIRNLQQLEQAATQRAAGSIS